jgi:hypothetical protein
MHLLSISADTGHLDVKFLLVTSSLVMDAYYKAYIHVANLVSVNGAVTIP